MDGFYSIAVWLIVSLGIITTITGLIIFLSCRCFSSWKPGSKLMNNATYKRFFKTHCNLWWVFWILAIIHAVIALLYFFSSF